MVLLAIVCLQELVFVIVTLILGQSLKEVECLKAVEEFVRDVH